MNIFFLSPNPRQCAKWHCDKHVVKMILESTQILYTCHHLHGGSARVEAKAPICLTTGKRGYKKHAAKHPSVLWAASALPHYIWLCWLALELVREHAYRFQPKRPHSSLEHLVWLVRHAPPGLCGQLQWISAPTPAMPDEYKVYDTVEECYRAYYMGQKRERGLLKWTRRHRPHVF